MNILLDTNIYSSWKRGHPRINDLIKQSRIVLLSSIVAGELFFGFQVGGRFQKNARELRAFLQNPRTDLCPVTLDTADRYGRIASQLREQGTPIPNNDIWIAAQAMEKGAHLVSFDRHFEHVEGLIWVRP